MTGRLAPTLAAGVRAVAHCDVTLLGDPVSRVRWFAPSWQAFWPAGPHDDFVAVRRTW